MARKDRELTDEQWALIERFMRRQDRAGHPWSPHRRVVEGVFWVLRTGAPWRDLPKDYGPWQTVYSRFKRWREDGTWDHMLQELQADRELAGEIDWSLFSVDGSNVRGSRAAAGAGKRGPDEPEDHALGLSRGGYGSKIHIICDGVGLPLAVTVTPGQRHESTEFVVATDAVRVRAPSGRICQRSEAVAADKAYSNKNIRAWLRSRGIKATIPNKKDKRTRKTPRRGRRIELNKTRYRRRNVVERCIGWLKENPRVGARYEKLALNFLQMVKLAMLKRYLKT